MPLHKLRPLLEEDRDTSNRSAVRVVGALLHFEVVGFGKTMVVNSAEAINLAAWLVALLPDGPGRFQVANGPERFAAVLEHIRQNKA
jgi:hypothetical protein